MIISEVKPGTIAHMLSYMSHNGDMPHPCTPCRQLISSYNYKGELISEKTNSNDMQMSNTQDTGPLTNIESKINVKHLIMHKYSTEIEPIMNSLKIKEQQRIRMKMRDDF